MGYSRQQQRILWKDDATIVDLTASLNNYRADNETIAFVAAEDYLFIGSDLPFNHRYVEVAAVNAASSVFSVDIWWSNAWHAAVDLIDQTKTGGVSLAKSGLVQWSPDELKGWDREQNSEDVIGLEGTKIYDMFWVRLALSGNLTGTTAIKYIGHKFCDDADLEGTYPILKPAGLKTAWAAGKTDWKDQIFDASEAIVRDLKRQGIIKSPSQLMDPEILRNACVHKAAELIFSGLGTAYIDMKKESAKAYSTALDMKMFVVDRNGDARASVSERYLSSGVLRRG